MKVLRHILFASAFSVVLYSCNQEEPDIPMPDIVITDQVVTDFETASITCAVSGNVSVEGLILEYSKEQSLADAMTLDIEKAGDSYKLTLSDLEIQTTYYYRYSIVNKASTYTEDKIRTFKTKDFIPPVVSTGEVTNISGTKATLAGTVEFACGKEITEKGFMVGKDPLSLEKKVAESEEFSLTVEELEFETSYYYQAFAKTEIGVGKGEIKEFKTNKAVSFKEVAVKDITATSASFTGGILDNGGIDIEKEGFYYSVQGGEGVFVEAEGTASVEALIPATSYQVWYYAKTFEGEFESEKIDFETRDGIVLITTSSPENINTSSAILKGYISSDGGSAITERGFCYGKNAAPSVSDTKVKVNGTTGEYQYELKNLPQNSSYYVRAYAINGIGTYYGEDVSFTTLYDPVVFGTTTCTNVTASSASLKGSITSNGGSTVTKCGFCYATSSNPTTEDQIVEVTGSKTNLTATIKNLKSGVTYYVRAFAINANSTFYSNEVSFVTDDGKIQFTAPVLSNIAAESFVASSSIISAGGGTITERGFCYGLTKNPTTSNSTVKASGTTGEYDCTITGLKNKTVYYVRAYAINESGTYYSEEATLTTMSGIATLTTAAATNVRALTATINGEIESDGGSNITERGFCYGIDANPTTSATVVKISGTVGSITKDLANLTKATKYYVRAYATNGYGTHYGNEISFTTSDGKVLFDSVTSPDVTVSSVKVATNITSDGDNTITQRGFCYSTSTEPTISDKKITVVGTTGSLSGTIANLTNNTKYYVRAFATNETGTSYSSEIAVTTLSGIPDVETTSVVNVKAQNVDVTGNVLTSNGGTITSRGFCYSTAETPTIADSKVTVTGTTSTMTKTIGSLLPATTYHVRAFATTSFGTAYGADKVFTTQSGVITFANLGATNVRAVSATLSVDVTSDGGSEITEKGFCYATSEMPTVTDNKIVFSGDNTSYTKVINNLSRSTAYYFRAYAKNALGVYYSNQVIVLTDSGIPALSALTTTDVAQTTITLSGNVINDGGADITQRGFCYSTSYNPTTDSTVKTIEGTTGALLGTLAGLISDQKYYIRAFAKTQYGTAYSEELSVSTIAGIATLGKTTVHDINPTSVTLASTIVSNGGADIQSLGFCYSSSPEPTVSDNTVAANSYLASFSAQATSLLQNTKYYVRAFATTQYGTSYGEEVFFTTTYYPVEFGEVTVEDVLLRSMTLSGSITSDGGNGVDERGFCLSTNPNPTTSDIVVSMSGSTGSMKGGVNALQHSSKYYVRPYAINSIDTFYGDQYEFETRIVPEGAAPGIYRVYTGAIHDESHTKRVFLAKGNLEFSRSDKRWSFAENQLYPTEGVVSTFEWGSSGYNENYPGCVNDEIQSIEGTEYDWGIHNPITNGGNNKGNWYVPTNGDFGRLFAGHWSWVSISGIEGVLLLPEDWISPAGIEGIDQNNSSYSLEEWVRMEKNGAVFFPEDARNSYTGNSRDVSFDRATYYWSSSAYVAYYVYMGTIVRPYAFSFNKEGSNTSISTNVMFYIFVPCAVRLIQDF